MTHRHDQPPKVTIDGSQILIEPPEGWPSSAAFECPHCGLGYRFGSECKHICDGSGTIGWEDEEGCGTTWLVEDSGMRICLSCDYREF